jgi:hypothetical protein
MAQLQGKDVNIYIRENGSTGAFKRLVCTSSTGEEFSPNQVTVVTNCGPLTMINDTPVSFPLDGIVKVDPDSDEVSYNELKSYIINGTLVDVEYKSDDNSVYTTCSAYLTALSLSSPSEGFATFTGSITSTGTIDITP